MTYEKEKVERLTSVFGFISDCGLGWAPIMPERLVTHYKEDSDPAVLNRCTLHSADIYKLATGIDTPKHDTVGSFWRTMLRSP